MAYEIPHGPSGTIAGDQCIWVYDPEHPSGGLWMSLAQLGITPPTPTPTPTPTPSPSGTVTPYGGISSPSGNAWGTPIFDDEFDGSTLASHWAPNWFGDGTVLVKYEEDGKRMRWAGGREEFEEMARDGRFGGSMNNVHTWAKNVSVANGVCTLALPDTSDGALISTNPNGGAGDGGFTFTGGYAEARCNFPGSNGQIDNWPAFWCDGQNWPTDGEMDVVEGLGGNAAYHFHDPSGGPGSSVSGDYTGWHVYGGLWIPGQSVEYFYDGKSVGKITSGITNAPMYLICNIGSGNYGGPVVAPSAIEIDYVRVWALP